MTWRCARVQKWLPDLAAGDLWGFRRLQVEAHLETCPHCRQEWAELGRVVQEIASHPVSDPPPAFWEEFDRELHLKLAGASPATASSPWRPWKYLVWAAPVATALVLWAVLPLLRTPPGEIPAPGDHLVQREITSPAPKPAAPSASLALAPRAKLAARVPEAAAPQGMRSSCEALARGPLEYEDPLLGAAPEDILEGLSPEDVETVFDRLNHMGGR